jgi:hypothetical protein
MNTIFSIRNNFTEQIFNGNKPLEFRNSIGKDVEANSTIYIYETKRNSGAGSVIGSVRIKSIIDIPWHRVGTYFILPYYVQLFGSEEEKEAVEKGMKVDLLDYDNSLILSYLFNDRILDYIEINKDIPNACEDAHYFYQFGREYKDRDRKAKVLCNKCDEWAEQIGFYDSSGSSFWKYAIELIEPNLFDQGIPISEFKGRDGNFLTKAPQSWCYTLH